ncbi:hypothetical protein VYU27_002282 [Nannochloropsis oceanica]
MSTMNSTSMSVNRPTTKVIHAPGGASSISIFGEQEQKPAAGGSGAKPTFKANFEPSFEISAPAVPMVEKAALTPEPVVVVVETPAVAAATTDKMTMTPATLSPSTKTAATTTTSECNTPAPPTAIDAQAIGVVYASSSPLQRTLKTRTLDALAVRGVATATMEVGDVLQLPLAAKRMAATGTYAAVVVVAILTEDSNFAAKEVAGAVTSGLVSVSTSASLTVVPGLIFAASEKEAVTMMEKKPEAWADSALALAKGGDSCIVTTISSSSSSDTTTTITTAAVAPHAEVVPEACIVNTAANATPEKETVATPSVTEQMGELSLGAKARARAAAFAAENDAPIRRPSHRGGGPSSIIFG